MCSDGGGFRATVTATFTCSTIELTYLASVLGTEALVGVPDPFIGYLTEETEAAWAAARTALGERGVIALSPAGLPAVRADVARLVRICGQPDGSLMLTCTHGEGEAMACYLHTAEGLTVEQHASTEAASLRALTDSSQVWHRVRELLRLTDRPSPGSCPAATLPPAELASLRAMAFEQGALAAAAHLSQMGLPADTARLLSETLCRPVSNGSAISLIHRHGEWLAEGVGILEGENGLWLLRHSSPDMLLATPATGADAAEAVSRLVTDALSVPVA